MPKCSYCGNMYDLHKGVTLVLKDGNAKPLCSSKCRKNFNLKRRKVRWVTKKKKTEKEQLKEQLKKDAGPQSA